LYKILGKEIPEYLFGNYLPDGEPYEMYELSLKEKEVKTIEISFANSSGTIEFDGKIFY